MVEAGDPGVLRPLEDGRLTGVTCPSTCDTSRSSERISILSISTPVVLSIINLGDKA